MAEIKMQLVCPRAPNFISVDDGVKRSRQDGPSKLPTIPVSRLTVEQKDELAAEWRAKLDEVAERQAKGENDG